MLSHDASNSGPNKQRGRMMRCRHPRQYTIAFGQFALQKAQECGGITSRQIEASRRGHAPATSSGGANLDPDLPRQKPAPGALPKPDGAPVRQPGVLRAVAL